MDFVPAMGFAKDERLFFKLTLILGPLLKVAGFSFYDNLEEAA